MFMLPLLLPLTLLWPMLFLPFVLLEHQLLLSWFQPFSDVPAAAVVPTDVDVPEVLAVAQILEKVLK
jgi:hypothetical protein